MARTCPFEGCNLQIPDNIFACRAHWRPLNYNQKAEVYNAYNDYMDGRITFEELRRRQQVVLDQVQGNKDVERRRDRGEVQGAVAPVPGGGLGQPPKRR